MPVWHVSVSVWSRRNELVDAPGLAEAAAVRALAGVGGDREWWTCTRKVGHLRVPITPTEHDAIPPGVAVHDAGDAGPERARTIYPSQKGTR